VRDEADQIVAGMPIILFEGKRLKKIIPIHEFQSTSFGLYGGPIFRRDADKPTLLEAIFQKLNELLNTWKADCIEIVDNHHNENNFEPYGFIAKTKFTHTINIDGSMDSIVQSFKGSVKRHINRARREKVLVEEIHNVKDLDEFYAIAVATWQKHGREPAYPLDLYRNLYSCLSPKGMIRVHIARHNGKPIAGIMHFLYRTTITNWMAGSYSEYLSMRPNHLLVYSIIEEGVKEGYKEYDCGPSPRTATGLIRFKESFGATEVPYQYWTRKTLAYAQAERLRAIIWTARRLAWRNKNSRHRRFQ
jgi:lipid II:glycine glycyltransferase (peptidoglycan interpeptide bridge formation enzyme)